MNILIRAATIFDPNSSFHRQLKDVLILNGRIERVASKIKNAEGYKEVSSANLCISPGWFDMNVTFSDPGFEYKEDITSGCKAAAFGGFTGVACMPHTYPVIHSKSEVEYVIHKASKELVEVYPLGAISRDLEGKEITEMYDMYASGAVAFSDGNGNYLNAGLMERSLLYVKPFGGCILSHPEDQSISLGGTMNEGLTSVSLGMKGVPALAEEIALVRDIYLAEYTDSKIHFLNVSTKSAVDLIRNAKRKGLKVSASVNAYNLYLDESLLEGYDTSYKVNPYLRTKEDIRALILGLKEGVIDNICSAHSPHEEESKKVEFEHAAFGMIGLETAFAVANSAIGKLVKPEQLVELLAINPRKILNIEQPVIKRGEKANLTIFDPKQKWTFEQEHIQSKSRNTPFAGQQFVGKVLGVINKNKLFLS